MENVYICIVMARYIFNPEHDLCLASGEVDYIPPASAVEFAHQCRWIERYMADGASAGGEIVPWGWNSALRKKLLQEGCPADSLPDDKFLGFIRSNSRREGTVELLGQLWNDGGDSWKSGIVSPEYRIVARNIQEVEEFLGRMGRVVLKSPLSGSGKGIRFVAGELMETDRGWCRRTLERQGGVVVEQRLDVEQEFAMLFGYGPDAEVRFVGYSLFYAANGAYKWNLLASNGHIEGLLGKWVAPDVLEKVRCGVERFLQERLDEAVGQGCRILRGYVGVDQFICRRGQGEVPLYNPSVEINLRMTMGHVARNIFDLHAEELGLGEGTHCFEPLQGVIPAVI